MGGDQEKTQLAQAPDQVTAKTETSDSSDAFQKQFQAELTKAADKQKEVTEKGAEKPSEQFRALTDFSEKYAALGTAASELLKVMKSGKADDDFIEVDNGNGQMVRVNVGEAKQVLKNFIKQGAGVDIGDDANVVAAFVRAAGGIAIDAADKIKQTPEEKDKSGKSVMELMGDVAKERDEIAKKLGLEKQTQKYVGLDGKEHEISVYNPQEVQQKMMAAAQGSDEQKQLQRLVDLSVEHERLEQQQVQSGVARLKLAELKLKGLTDATSPAAQDDQIAGSKSERMDAYQLALEAGRMAPRLSNDPMYQQMKKVAGDSYSQIVMEKLAPSVQALQQADQLRSSGKKPEAEQAYKDTMSKVEQTIKDIEKEGGKSIRQQFNAAEEGSELKARLGQLIHISKESKTEYAKFLNEQGRYQEARQLCTKALAEAPDFCQADKSFGKVFQEATAGKTMAPGEIEKGHAEFQRFMNEKNWSGAKKELDALKKGHEDMVANLKKSVATDAPRKKEIEDALKKLPDDKSMNEADRAIKKQQLETEKKLIEANEKAVKDLERQTQQYTYMEGILAYSQNDKKRAHDLFEQLKGTEIAKDGKYQLSDLLEDTREKGWLERNWDSIKKWGTIGLAVLAGVAVGALTFWSGPGALVFGAGTTAAILASAGIAIGAGAVAGGFTYAGANKAGVEIAKANEWKSTAAYYEKPDFWKDFGEGAKWGAIGASIPVTAGASAELGAIGGLANVPRIGGAFRFASSWKGAATIGFGSSGAEQTYQVVANGKDLKSAGMDLLVDGGTRMFVTKGIGNLAVNSGSYQAAIMANSGRSALPAALNTVGQTTKYVGYNMGAPWLGQGSGLGGRTLATAFTVAPLGINEYVDYKANKPWNPEDPEMGQATWSRIQTYHQPLKVHETVQPQIDESGQPVQQQTFEDPFEAAMKKPGEK